MNQRLSPVGSKPGSTRPDLLRLLDGFAAGLPGRSDEELMAALADRPPATDCGRVRGLVRRTRRELRGRTPASRKAVAEAAICSPDARFWDLERIASLYRHLAEGRACPRCGLRLLALRGDDQALSRHSLLEAAVFEGLPPVRVLASLRPSDLFFRLGLPEPLAAVARRVDLATSELLDRIEEARGSILRSGSMLASTAEVMWSLDSPYADLASWDAEHPEPAVAAPARYRMQPIAAAPTAEASDPRKVELLGRADGPGSLVELREVVIDGRWETRATLLAEDDAAFPGSFSWAVEFDPHDLLAYGSEETDSALRRDLGVLRALRGEVAWNDLWDRLVPSRSGTLPSPEDDQVLRLPGRLPGRPVRYETTVTEEAP